MTITKLTRREVLAAAETLARVLGQSPAARSEQLLSARMPGLIKVARGGKRRLRREVIVQRVERAQKRVDPKALYLIRRNGVLFRPNAQGYTQNLADAGVWHGNEARKYLDAEGVDLIPLTSVRDRIVFEMATTVSAAGQRVTALQHLLEMMEGRIHG